MESVAPESVTNEGAVTIEKVIGSDSGSVAVSVTVVDAFSSTVTSLSVPNTGGKLLLPPPPPMPPPAPPPTPPPAPPPPAPPPSPPPTPPPSPPAAPPPPPADPPSSPVVAFGPQADNAATTTTTVAKRQNAELTKTPENGKRVGLNARVSADGSPHR